jgi:hypothetical protein
MMLAAVLIFLLFNQYVVAPAEQLAGYYTKEMNSGLFGAWGLWILRYDDRAVPAEERLE